MRFPEFSGEWESQKLATYLCENKERNRYGEFCKSDVLSVSGDWGIVNQIKLLGRSFAGKSVADYHVVRTGDIVYTKSPLREYPYGIVKYNSGKDGIVSTLYAVYHPKENVYGQFVEHEFSHLDGVLFTDLVAPIRRKMLAKKLVNISHGKVGTQYKSKIK